MCEYSGIDLTSTASFQSRPLFNEINLGIAFIIAISVSGHIL